MGWGVVGGVQEKEKEKKKTSREEQEVVKAMGGTAKEVGGVKS